MINEYPETVEELIDQFRRLPTIGKKTAQRIVLSLISRNPEGLETLSDALLAVRKKIHPCPICGNLTDQEICEICSDPRRDPAFLCVVEDVQNLFAVERGGSYRGRYHVLKGLISPMNDMGPGEIGVDQLLERISKSKREGAPVKEVILAISPTVEGETTMLFLADLLHREKIAVSRIASGIPVGGSLEYYDELTLSRALEDRRSI